MILAAHRIPRRFSKCPVPTVQSITHQLNQCREAQEDLIILNTLRLGPSTVLSGVTQEGGASHLPTRPLSTGSWAVFHKSLSLWEQVQISRPKCKFSSVWVSAKSSLIFSVSLSHLACLKFRLQWLPVFYLPTSPRLLSPTLMK